MIYLQHTVRILQRTTVDIWVYTVATYKHIISNYISYNLKILYLNILQYSTYVNNTIEN